MKLFLYRVYDGANLKRLLFSEKTINIDSFTMRYKNNKEMIDYFDKMPIVYTPDGAVEEGRFAVFRKVERIDEKTNNKTVDFIEEKIYFEKDLRGIVQRVFGDDCLLHFLLENYPDMFGMKICNIITSNKKELPGVVLKLHHDTLLNSIKTRYVSIRDLDSVISMYDSFEMSDNAEVKPKTFLKNNRK